MLGELWMVSITSRATTLLAGHNHDRPFAGNDAEMATVQRGHTATVAFGTGDDDGVDKTERKISIALNQRPNPIDIAGASIEDVGPFCDIQEEGVKR